MFPLYLQAFANKLFFQLLVIVDTDRATFRATKAKFIVVQSSLRYLSVEIFLLRPWAKTRNVLCFRTNFPWNAKNGVNVPICLVQSILDPTAFKIAVQSSPCVHETFFKSTLFGREYCSSSAALAVEPSLCDCRARFAVCKRSLSHYTSSTSEFSISTLEIKLLISAFNSLISG